MGRLAMKGEYGGYQGRLQKPVADPELGTDMGMQRDIDIVEHPIADEIGPGQELFLRRCPQHLEGAGQIQFFHGAADGDGGADHYRGVDVMAFAMAGRALDDADLFGNARLLAVVGIAVELGVQRDDRFTGPVSGQERCGKSRQPARHLETVFLEQPAHQGGAFVFLVPELAKIENAVTDEGNGIGVAIDAIKRHALRWAKVLVRHYSISPSVQMSKASRSSTGSP